MKLSQLNNYIQTLATIGAIFGLLLVSYEIQQSGRVARAESSSANWIAQSEAALMAIESGVGSALLNSMMSPNELTIEEKLDLDFYFSSLMLRINNEFAQILILEGEAEGSTKYYEDLLERIAPDLLPGPWARAWAQESEPFFFFPQVAAAINRGLKKTAPNALLEKYKRIDERATAG